MSVSLYQQYLVADMVTKRMRAVGAQPGGISMLSSFGVFVHLGYVSGRGGAWDSAESREEIVADFLARYPDASVDRTPNDYGEPVPQMKVSGTTSVGIRWEIDFGTGSCERVQVGTETKEVYDPEALAAVPKVTVEEPVFEYRCPDPIVQAGLL